MILSASRCYIGGGSKSSQATTDSRIATTDSSGVAQGEAVQVRDDGSATVIRGSKNNLGGLTFDSTGNVSITTSDALVISEALKTVADLSSKAQASLATAAGTALSSVTDLAATRLTDGKTNTDKTVLLVAIAGMAGLAYVVTKMGHR